MPLGRSVPVPIYFYFVMSAALTHKKKLLLVYRSTPMSSYAPGLNVDHNLHRSREFEIAKSKLKCVH